MIKKRQNEKYSIENSKSNKLKILIVQELKGGYLGLDTFVEAS